MDNDGSNLSDNDPYNGMERAKTKPNFEDMASNAADAVDAIKNRNNAKNSLNKGEKNASKGKLGGDSVKGGEQNPKGLFKGGGSGGGTKGAAAAGNGNKAAAVMSLFSRKKDNKGEKAGKGERGQKGDKKGKGKGGIFAKAAIGVLAIILMLIFMIFAGPIYTIGALDFGLQRETGQEDLDRTVEDQAKYSSAEMVENGEVAVEYARDLMAAGIELGQTTIAGEFLPLDTVASLEDNYYKTGNGGGLSIRFEGEIINGSDFVAAVDSNPRLYAAFAKAADVKARFNYSDQVDDVYKDLDLSRGNFNDWERTGNREADMNSYYEHLYKALDGDSLVDVYGCDESKQDCVNESISSSDNASATVSAVANKTTGDNATKKAAQLLNAAITSEEPVKAAKAFVAVEEPLQRARIDGDGPANETLTVLTYRTEVTYTDAETGELVTTKESIMDTKNFIAVVSGGHYSKEDAEDFSTDRALTITDSGNDEVDKTTVDNEGVESSSSFIEIKDGESADNEVLEKVSNSVDVGVLKKGSEVFQSRIGGERTVEGGLHLSSVISQKTIGGLGSDEEAINTYHNKMEEVGMRRAEADRATKSPFDVSSPYTFFGSMVYNFHRGILGSYSGGGGIITSTVSRTMGGISNSIAGLADKVMADGEGQGGLVTIFGKGLTVEKAGGAKASIYGTALRTVAMDYEAYKKEDWKNKGMIDENGKITDKVKGLVHTVKERDSTLGVKDAGVCRRYKIDNPNIIREIREIVSKIFGTYEECNTVDEVDPGIATGASSVLSRDNPNYEEMKEYSAFMLYDTTYSILSGQKSAIAQYEEEYYAKHPKDNSRAGKIARRSGMTKAEAEIALAYADYLTEIANYDSSDRYVFGKIEFDKKDSLLIRQAKKTRDDIYLMWYNKTEYADSRNRNFVV